MELHDEELELVQDGEERGFQTGKVLFLFPFVCVLLYWVCLETINVFFSLQLYNYIFSDDNNESLRADIAFLKKILDTKVKKKEMMTCLLQFEAAKEARVGRERGRH